MRMECFKEMPCSLKLAYVLIALLFFFNITFCCCRCKSGKGGKGSSNNIEIWVNEHPEIILESVNRYAIKQQEELLKQQRQQATENIKNLDKELKDTKYAGVLNPKGTIEIVEFYDYNCGYCKIAHKSVEQLLKDKKDVKVILRNIPILSQASRYAAEVGMAILIESPAKYPEYHKALMDGSARTKEEVAKAVSSVGLNMSKLEKVLEKNKTEIDSAIQNNMELANKVGINGTPAFIINGELIPGAVDAQTLKNMVEEKK